MKSMTGFGKSEITIDGRKIRVEIKSVNHRYLDVNVRMPRFLLFLEDEVRKYLKTAVSRGRIDVFVNYSSEREDAKMVALDLSVVKGYLDAAKRIDNRTGYKKRPSGGRSFKAARCRFF